MFNKLTESVGPESPIAKKAELLHTRVMLHYGKIDYLISIKEGVVLSVEPGPHVMPSYDFSFTATSEEWDKFFLTTPPPGSHDIMAMLRRGEMRFDGNLHPLMSNLMYFKQLLASLRLQEV